MRRGEQQTPGRARVHAPSVFAAAWDAHGGATYLALSRLRGSLCRPQQPAKTLTVDRAWLESLLLDEMGAR